QSGGQTGQELARSCRAVVGEGDLQRWFYAHAERLAHSSDLGLILSAGAQIHAGLAHLVRSKAVLAELTRLGARHLPCQASEHFLAPNGEPRVVAEIERRRFDRLVRPWVCGSVAR